MKKNIILLIILVFVVNIGYQSLVAQDDDLQDAIIIFESARSGNGDLYSSDAYGRNLQQITFEDTIEAHPSWSPDRSQIVFQSNRTGNNDIFTLDLANPVEYVQLVNHPANDFEPVWSPDGNKIAFTSDRDGDLNIYVMDADGRNVQALTRNTSAETNPTWSPDSAKIAFTSNREGSDDIYVMNADGSEPRILASSSVVDNFPNWSPDGKYVAFTSDRDGDSDVYIVEVETREETKLTNNAVLDANPSWSFDSQYIVFSSQQDGNNEIYSMNNNGTAIQRLTFDAGADTMPVWSPPSIKIIGIQVSDSQIETVLSEETVDLPNCGGTSELTSIPSYVRAIERTVTVATANSQNQCDAEATQIEGDLNVNFSLLVFDIRLSPRIQREFENSLCTATEETLYVKESETVVQSRELVLSAAPGTSVSYNIQWQMVSQTGQIIVERGAKTVFVDFQLPESLRGIVTSSTNNGCP